MWVFLYSRIRDQAGGRQGKEDDRGKILPGIQAVDKMDGSFQIDGIHLILPGVSLVGNWRNSLKLPMGKSKTGFDPSPVEKGRG